MSNIRLLAEPNNATYNGWISSIDQAYNEVLKRPATNDEVATALAGFEAGENADILKGRLQASILIPILMLL